MTTLTKQLSEADIALFVLVTAETQVVAEEPKDLNRQARQIVPQAFVAALLTVGVARHATRPGAAQIVSQTVAFGEPAYTDDTLTATAQVTAHDPSTSVLRIQVRCENQEGRRLAEGEFLLKD